MADDSIYRSSIDKSLTYIEEHLTQSIDMEELVRESQFSQPHFYRIFLSMIGTTAANYIRNRRLTAAAAELSNSESRILELALKYGFGSQEAFTRAFKKMYGITPGQYRTYSKSLIRKDEQIVNMESVPKGWTVAGDQTQNYEVSLDRQEVHVGTASALLQSKSEAPNGFITLMQIFKADRYLGKRVRLTAFVKAENVLGWAGLWMRMDHSSGEMLGFDNMQNRPIQGTSSWSPYAVVLDVPDNTQAIAFGALLSGEGKVWVDNFQIEEVDLKTPTTDQHDDLYPEAPTNLDFEGE